MAGINNLEQAKITFEALCHALDNNDWHYNKDEENLSITCGAQGEDLPMEIKIKIDLDRMLVLLFSFMPFDIQEDKRIDAAIAVSAINNALVDGSFDYDISSGSIYFRMSNSFIDSKLGEEVFLYMLYCSCQTIDEYNDKFLMLSKGILSVEQFIASLND